MDNWFNSKWFVRGISLAFAILLYVFVNVETTTQSDSLIPGGTDTDKVQTLNDVPVSIRIDGDRYVVSGVPEFVTVSLEGPNSVLTAVVMQRNFELYVDLEDLGEGTHTVDIEYARIPDEISVYIEPKTIDVSIEERATEEFVVDVDFINIDKLPEGYELGEPEINPETVTITSSRSIIDQIAIVKVYIDVAGLTEPINNREVPVNVYDSQGNGLSVRIAPESVVVSVDIYNPSKVVPIEVTTTGELAENLTLQSLTPEIDEIEIFAVTEVLETIEVIKTEEIDLSEITESTSVDVKLDLPAGVQVADEEITVNVDIEKTETFEDVPIEYEALGNGQDLTFLNPSDPFMSMTIIGDDKDVNELSRDDFQLFINIKDLGEGEHRVPVVIEGPDYIEASVEFEEVMIQIISE